MRSPRLFVLLMAGAAMVAASLTSAQTAPRLLVLNKTDATLAIVDPATRAVLGTVPTGEAPHELAVSADGKLAFVANYGAQTPGHTISMIDLGARKELRRVEVAPLLRPHGIQVVNGRVYFTSEIARVVARYDPEADRVDWIFGTGQDTTHMLRVSSDETRIVTANIRGNSLSILERGQNPLAWTASVVAVGRGPEGFDLSPDGTQIWAANSADGTVSIVDVALEARRRHNPGAHEAVEPSEVHAGRHARPHHRPGRGRAGRGGRRVACRRHARPARPVARGHPDTARRKRGLRRGHRRRPRGGRRPEDLQGDGDDRARRRP